MHPTLINIFMNILKCQELKGSPSDLKPVFHRQFMDDHTCISLLFFDHTEKFKKYFMLKRNFLVFFTFSLKFLQNFTSV